MINKRFRGFLPVVADIETAGLDPKHDAVLEIAFVLITLEDGIFVPGQTYAENILPYKGANLDPAALEFNGIKDPWYPLRFALQEKEALTKLFAPVKDELKKTGCSRAIMVAHNAWFDLHFLNAAVKRTKVKSVFHGFSSIDTASLGMLVYGHSVLAELAGKTGISWSDSDAHSAIYDAQITAKIFCMMLNAQKID